MAIATRTVTIALALWLAIILAVVVGGVLLQIFLSKREHWLPGLILPAVTFLHSLLGLLGMAAYGVRAGQFALQAFGVMLLLNIPTLILLAVYFSCRARKRRQEEIDKMNIQDLD